MIKFYKNKKEYAEVNWIHRDTASKRIKYMIVEVHKVPKGMNYIEIDKEAIIAEYINKLNKNG